jgi:hypothetical protein
METMPLMHHHPGRIVMEVSNEFNESDKSPHPQNKSSMAKMNMKVTRREATHARVYDDCVPAISHFRVVARHNFSSNGNLLIPKWLHKALIINLNSLSRM